MKNTKPPAFKNESEEADWWASEEGRDYVKQKSALNRESAQTRSQGQKIGGSRLVDNLNRKRSVQIAIRLPEADIEQARKIASRKVIGYQTLLKMLVHEGLEREGKRRKRHFRHDLTTFREVRERGGGFLHVSGRRRRRTTPSPGRCIPRRPRCPPRSL